MFSRYQRAVEETRDLDLLPVMNLFMVLIPFLLMGAAFYHIGAIPASLPNHSTEQSAAAEEPSEVAVTVHLVITEAQLQVSAASEALDADTLRGLGRTFPKLATGYDLKALREHLQRIKAKYPKSDTAMVLPYGDLQYEQLVSVLDASRDYPKGVDAKGDPIYGDLFPKVVFSRFIAPTGDTAPAPPTSTTPAASAPSVQETP